MFAHGPSELWNALQWVGTHSLCALGGFFIGLRGRSADHRRRTPEIAP